MAKQSTVTLRHLPFYVPAHDQDPRWRVERITDSLLHNPGDYLTKVQVEALVSNAAWKVTIIPYDAK